MIRLAAAALALTLLTAAAPAPLRPPLGQERIRTEILQNLRTWGIYPGAVIQLGNWTFQVEAISVDFAGPDPTTSVKFKRLN